jgi:hypothetical protein
MTDPETITLRATVIGGQRYPDDYTVIWRELPIGRIMKRMTRAELSTDERLKSR